MSLRQAEWANFEEARIRRGITLIVHDIDQSSYIEEYKAACEAICASKRTKHGPTNNREPQVAISQVILGFLFDQIGQFLFLLDA